MNTSRIDIRVTPEEKAIIQHEAEKKRISVSQYIMLCVAKQFNEENSDQQLFPLNFGRRK